MLNLRNVIKTISSVAVERVRSRLRSVAFSLIAYLHAYAWEKDQLAEMCHPSTRLSHVYATSLLMTSFTRPSPALVLQAINAGVRRPGYEAMAVLVLMSQATYEAEQPQSTLPRGSKKINALLTPLRFKKHFHLSTEGTTDCSVEDVLIFFTGAAKIPPLGFEKVPSITFQHCPTAKFATSSTCDPELRLPTRHGDDVVAFREAMIMSLMDNDGFGGV